MRIGRVAALLLETPPVYAHVLLHGSFAKTYRGHGTDRALAAGIMGMRPDDPRIRESLELAAQAGIQVVFEEGAIPDAHPNTALLTLRDAGGREVVVQGASVGGGNILISRVNGMEVSLTGEHTTFIVLHRDTPGTIAAVTRFMAERGINICNFHLSRQNKGGLAVMTIEIDSDADGEICRQIGGMPNIRGAVLLHAD